MGQSYFVWNNRDCRAMGVKTAGAFPIIRPEERAEHLTIPGRSGDLTLLEDEEDPIYNSYIQTGSIMVRGWNNVRQVYQWLRGAGYVTFSGEPDRRQKARVIGAITLNRHSYNLDWWEGEVQFYCQPLKELLQGKTVEVTATNTPIRNSGDVNEKPVILLKASGTTAKVKIGGRELTLTGLTSGAEYTVDCDAEEVTAEVSGETVSLTNKSSGRFPVILPGDNTITGTGWSKLTITRRERFL